MVLHNQSRPSSTGIRRAPTGAEGVLDLTPSPIEMRDVWTLLKRLEECKESGEVNGIGVVRNFMGQRIQPIKEWVNPSYEYEGPQDTTRELPEQWVTEDLNECVSLLFQGDVNVKDASCPAGYHLRNPPDQVCSFADLFYFVAFRVSLTRPSVVLTWSGHMQGL